MLCTLASFAAAACAQGEGEGSAIGTVWAPDCALEAEPFDLQPNFFALTSRRTADAVTIRVQHGSVSQHDSDGVSLQVFDAEMVRESLLGMPLDMSAAETDPDFPIRMNFFLGDLCRDRLELPINYTAISGTVQIDELYVPWVDDSPTTSVTFTDLEFVDPEEPIKRRAVLSGNFRFDFDRGRPEQRFP